jgi:hypothetical protein
MLKMFKMIKMFQQKTANAKQLLDIFNRQKKSNSLMHNYLESYQN